MNGASFDIEYDTSAVKEMVKVSQFTTVSAAIDRAVYLKQQLDRRPHTTRAVKRPHTQAAAERQNPTPKNYGTINNELSPKVFA